jgi:hypothetical protein
MPAAQKFPVCIEPNDGTVSLAGSHGEQSEASGKNRGSCREFVGAVGECLPFVYRVDRDLEGGNIFLGFDWVRMGSAPFLMSGFGEIDGLGEVPGTMVLLFDG